MLPIEQTCFWLATGRRAARPPAQIPPRCDVAVIGGGLTGLWTALFLQDLSPASSVVLLEAESVAYGASGRNAGMLSETIDHTHALAVDHFGENEARRLAALGQQNLAEMARWLADRKVDCGLELTGRLQVALTDGQLADCARAAETARRLGVTTHTLLGAAETRARLNSPLYLGGVLVSSGGILDPVKLVHGLCREAERRGATVAEGCRVEAFHKSGAGVAIQHSRGSLLATRAVLATNAYTHHLVPRLLRRFIPLYDYILVSEPLTPEQRAAMGWSGREGVTDGRTFFNYYRLTRDQRILWGTSEATYYPGNRVGPAHDHSIPHYAGLERSFHRHFPDFGPLAFPYRWGGPIAATTRMTPTFGSLLDGRVLYGLGYTGHGLGTTRIAGRLLAHLALGRPSDLARLQLVTRPPFPYPPEPVRRLAVGLVTRALRRVDAGQPPNLLLRLLDRLGIGFSS